MTVATCNRCSQALRLPDGSPGAVFRCPHCGNIFRAPEEAPAPTRASTTARGSGGSSEVAAPAGVPRRAPARRKSAPNPESEPRLSRPSRVARRPLLTAGLVIASFGVVFTCGLGAIALGWLYLRTPEGAPALDNRAPPANPVAGRPPAADVPEESKNWTVLFRADDPALWDTDSPGPQFALPLRRAPDTVHYVRLRRMDTGDALILSLPRRLLGNGETPAAGQKYGWNGTAKLEYSGRHLGIVEGTRQRFPAPDGMIVVLNDGWDCFAGSGFGHKCRHDNDGQFYCWKGEPIPPTAFEIAVSAGPLTPAEERLLLGP